MYKIVKEFKKKNKISSRCELKELKRAIHNLGCNLLPYSSEMTKLISLGLDKKANNSFAFSVLEKDNLISVYFNDALSIEVQRFALAHELGHIVLGHLINEEEGKLQEQEADNFAQFLLTSCHSSHSGKTIAFCLLFLFSLLLFLKSESKSAPSTRQSVNYAITKFDVSSNVSSTTANIETKNTSDNSYSSSKETTSCTESDVCYFTVHGEVYHLYRDCHYIKNSSTVLHGTIDTCGKNRLCSACSRRQNK